jgi:hypothetical protein
VSPVLCHGLKANEGFVTSARVFELQDFKRNLLFAMPAGCAPGKAWVRRKHVKRS